MSKRGCCPHQKRFLPLMELRQKPSRLYMPSFDWWFKNRRGCKLYDLKEEEKVHLVPMVLIHRYIRVAELLRTKDEEAVPKTKPLGKSALLIASLVAMKQKMKQSVAAAAIGNSRCRRRFVFVKAEECKVQFLWYLSASEFMSCCRSFKDAEWTNGTSGIGYEYTHIM
ncbi:hypothetical protein GW17_00030847 [Ensete ventricosum]|nr:hypothetical protein GW17_00030847 [Ensete ventricosum]